MVPGGRLQRNLLPHCYGCRLLRPSAGHASRGGAGQKFSVQIADPAPSPVLGQCVISESARRVKPPLPVSTGLEITHIQNLGCAAPRSISSLRSRDSPDFCFSASSGRALPQRRVRKKSGETKRPPAGGPGARRNFFGNRGGGFEPPTCGSTAPCSPAQASAPTGSSGNQAD